MKMKMEKIYTIKKVYYKQNKNIHLNKNSYFYYNKL